MPPMDQEYVNVPDPPDMLGVSITYWPESIVADDGVTVAVGALLTVTVAKSDVAVTVGLAPDEAPVSVKTK